MGKKKNHNNNYWKNFPEELRLMCLAEVRGTGHYCTVPVLRCLADHMNECDSFIFGTTPYDVIRWIDTAVEMCLFPLEQHEDDWIANTEDIRKVLARSEELLLKIAPADYREGYRTPDDSCHEFNIIEYAQKLDVYFSILYMFTEEWERLRDRLEQLLSDTEQNVRHMLSYEDAEKYAAWDDWAEFHYVGTDTWEPLNWLCREFLPSGGARKLFAQVYEKYAFFLNELHESSRHSKALSHLITNAEKRLKDICALLLDEVEDCLESTKGDEQCLIADRELYDLMMQKSEKRYAADNEGTACTSGEMKDNIPERYFGLPF